MSGPIGPDEVAGVQISQIPEGVFKVFNAMIAQKFNGDSAVLNTADVIEQLEAAGFSRAQIQNDGLLNVEQAYGAKGWKVTYDKPDHGGPGGCFIFSRKKNH